MATTARKKPARKTARKPAQAPRGHGTDGSGTASAKKRPPKKAAKSRWSAGVTHTSDALDLESGVFKKRSARQIALSLKRSAEHSTRRKGTPYQSAMSMLTFEINRAGKGLSAERRHILENAKGELRKAFGRE